MSASRVTVNSAEEAQVLESYAAAAQKAEQAAASTTSPLPSVKVVGNARVEFKGGLMTAETGKATSVAIQGVSVPKGFVKLANGTLTPIEAAEAAGLMDLAVEFNKADKPVFKEGPSQAAPAAEAPKADKTGSEEGATLAVTEAEKAQITSAENAINKAGEVIGPTAVASIQQDVVSSGLLPTELPQGITSEMVEAVAAGYTAQANAVLRDTGANVDTLMTLLNENELRDARIAVFKGDDAMLKSLGGKAMERLRILPDDSALLAELTATWPKDYRVVRRSDGYWVEAPHAKVKWVDAVNSGEIRLQ